MNVRESKARLLEIQMELARLLENELRERGIQWRRGAGEGGQPCGWECAMDGDALNLPLDRLSERFMSPVASFIAAELGDSAHGRGVTLFTVEDGVARPDNRLFIQVHQPLTEGIPVSFHVAIGPDCSASCLFTVGYGFGEVGDVAD